MISIDVILEGYDPGVSLPYFILPISFETEVSLREQGVDVESEISEMLGGYSPETEIVIGVERLDDSIGFVVLPTIEAIGSPEDAFYSATENNNPLPPFIVGLVVDPELITEISCHPSSLAGIESRASNDRNQMQCM